MHSKLDEFLCDEALVEERRREQLAKPNKVNIGNECPVCDQAISKQHSRVHVIWHFMEELRGIVQSFNNPTVRFAMKPNHLPIRITLTTATVLFNKDGDKGRLSKDFFHYRFVTSATTRTKTLIKLLSI